MTNNPFSPKDEDRYYLWNMLVERDIDAFVAQNWNMVKDDFLESAFMGIDAGQMKNMDEWKLQFPSLDAYKKEWLEHAKITSETTWGEDIGQALHRITVLQHIEVQGESALVRKRCCGAIKKKDGLMENTDWQALYRCRKVDGQWKITGFTGSMPVTKKEREGPPKNLKSMPKGAGQHKTAGPYAPVLVVDPGKLVVISGQAAIDNNGDIVGDTIEEQAAYTLANCSKQLASAGCTLQDAFKVNVYIKDLGQWSRFNEVYKNYFEEPKPVRTAVETGLLKGLLVELEIWAVKK
ncbi:RidA family protein [Spongiimicrobium sp. 3-5]|uniref:RidA family protein n=1 Tax=Spongiimicrobium sp. 3-5 TaxID=3332596 RepID=UPI00397F1E0D